MAVAATFACLACLGGCSLIDPLDDLTGADASAGSTDATVDQDAAPDAAPDARRCNEAPFLGGNITEGFLCGVGACRKHLTGPDCRIESFPDGGRRSPCATVFPTDVGGDNLDNDCNGVVDDGHPSASPDAGFSCQGCAFGAAVQRLADGTLQNAGGAQNRGANKNTINCINSDRCKIGAADWIRNVSNMTCTNFCASIGATCKPACSTNAGVCDGPAVGINFGTYANDYRCLVHPSLPGAGNPLTGDCDKTFPGVIAANADFNLFCCCNL